MTKIAKAKGIHNAYYINGKGILLEHWNDLKGNGRFTTEEIKHFDNYIKSLCN